MTNVTRTVTGQSLDCVPDAVPQLTALRFLRLEFYSSQTACPLPAQISRTQLQQLIAVGPSFDGAFSFVSTLMRTHASSSGSWSNFGAWLAQTNQTLQHLAIANVDLTGPTFVRNWRRLVWPQLCHIS